MTICGAPVLDVLTRKSRSVAATQAAIVALIYGVVAALWILLSDSAVEALFDDPRRLSTAQTFKGWFFIAVTALLLFLLVRRVLSRLGASETMARASEAKYRALFQANPHPMWVYDLETLRFLAVNDAAVAHYGYSRDEFLSLTIRDIRPPEDIPRLLANVAAVTEGIDKAGIWHHCKKNGELIEVDIISHTLGFDDRRAEMVLAQDVTLQRQAERVQAESAERLRLALAAANQGLYDLDLQTGETITSPEYATMLGYDPAEFHETHSQWIERMHPDDREPATEIYRRYLAEEIPEYRVTFRQRTRAGAWKWILSVGSVVERDAQGTALRMIGTHTDITEQKCAEQRIRRLSALYAALSETNQAIMRESDPDALFRAICRALVEYGGMQLAWIGLRSADGMRVESVAAHGPGIRYVEDLDIQLDSALPQGRGPTGTAMSRGERYICNDFALDPITQPWREAAREAGIAASASFPLACSGEVVGALNLYASEAGFFDDELIGLLDETALDISFAIDNFERTARHRRLEGELRESEERFRHLLGSLDDVVWSAGLDTSQLLYVSPSAERIYGRPAADLMADPQHWVAAVHPDDIDRVHAASERLLATGHAQSEYRIVRPDGSVRWLFDRASIIRDEYGNALRLGGIASDITERKQAEEQVRLLSAAVEQSPASIVIADPQGNIQYVNPKFTELTGYAFDEVAGRNARILKSGHTSPEEYRAMWNTINSGGVWRGEFQNRKKNGELYWENALISPIHDGAGKITRFIAVKEDITARRQIESALRENRALLRTIIDAVPLWIAYLDRDGRHIVANRRYSETFHKSPEEIEGTHYSTVLPPQLVAIQRPLAQECMQGTAVSFTDDAELDPGGRTYVQGAYVPMFDSDGRIKGCVMAAMDITELRRSEERLLASEARLHEAQRLAHIGNWEYDIKTNRVFWSDEVYRIFEVDPWTFAATAEAFFECAHPEDRAAVETAYADSLASRTAFDMVFRVRTADERVKFAQVGCQTTYDADGAALRSIGTVQDITPLKQAAEEIRQLNDQLERRVAERTQELAHANADLESFSYSVSHDLRAPLRAINGFSQILLETEKERLTSDGRNMLERIAHNSIRMGQLIEDILAYSRAGRLLLQRTEVDLSALVRAIVEELGEAYPAAEISVHPLPRVSGDETMLRQIFTNLIGNALKFSSRRTRPSIEIGSGSPDAPGVFFVKDNGAGMDMRYAGKLFGIFQRMHSESDFPGTGVGLAIVKRLVERHGGRVWAEAAPDQGATFCLTLGA